MRGMALPNGTGVTLRRLIKVATTYGHENKEGTELNYHHNISQEYRNANCKN